MRVLWSSSTTRMLASDELDIVYSLTRLPMLGIDGDPYILCQPLDGDQDARDPLGSPSGPYYAGAFARRRTGEGEENGESPQRAIC